jgi:hypothetical protein
MHHDEAAAATAYLANCHRLGVHAQQLVALGAYRNMPIIQPRLHSPRAVIVIRRQQMTSQQHCHQLWS